MSFGLLKKGEDFIYEDRSLHFATLQSRGRQACVKPRRFQKTCRVWISLNQIGFDIIAACFDRANWIWLIVSFVLNKEMLHA